MRHSHFLFFQDVHLDLPTMTPLSDNSTVTLEVPIGKAYSAVVYITAETVAGVKTVFQFACDHATAAFQFLSQLAHDLAPYFKQFAVFIFKVLGECAKGVIYLPLACVLISSEFLVNNAETVLHVFLAVGAIVLVVFCVLRATLAVVHALIALHDRFYKDEVTYPSTPATSSVASTNTPSSGNNVTFADDGMSPDALAEALTAAIQPPPAPLYAIHSPPTLPTNPTLPATLPAAATPSPTSANANSPAPAPTPAPGPAAQSPSQQPRDLTPLIRDGVTAAMLENYKIQDWRGNEYTTYEDAMNRHCIPTPHEYMRGLRPGTTALLGRWSAPAKRQVADKFIVRFNKKHLDVHKGKPPSSSPQEEEARLYTSIHLWMEEDLVGSRLGNYNFQGKKDEDRVATRFHSMHLALDTWATTHRRALGPYHEFVLNHHIKITLEHKAYVERNKDRVDAHGNKRAS